LPVSRTATPESNALDPRSTGENEVVELVDADAPRE
jgi:hypothetical protein